MYVPDTLLPSSAFRIGRSPGRTSALPHFARYSFRLSCSLCARIGTHADVHILFASDQCLKHGVERIRHFLDAAAGAGQFGHFRAWCATVAALLGRSSATRAESTIADIPRRLANLTDDIVDGIVMHPTTTTRAFSGALLLDKFGKLYTPPMQQTDVDFSKLHYFSWGLLTRAFSPQIADYVKAQNLDPIVTVAGPDPIFLLTNQRDILVVNDTWGVSSITNAPHILSPLGASKFTHLVSRNYSVGMIADTGDAFVIALDSDLCTTGTSVRSSSTQSRLSLPVGSNVTMIDTLYQHGVAVVESVSGVQTVYAWGAGSFMGIGNSSSACFLPQPVSLSTTALQTGDRIKFVVASIPETHLVTNLGRVISFGVDGPRFDTQLEAISIGSGLSIVQMITSSGGLHVLLSDGSMWSRMPPIFDVSYDLQSLALSDLSNKNNITFIALWKADFSPDLPPDYKIGKLIASA